jgi:hypothetical protein
MGNRFTQIEFVTDYADWRAWAVTADITPEVIAFLGSYQGREFLNKFNPAMQINATQRSWEMASDAMKALSGRKNESLTRKAVAGAIGEEAMIKFFSWIKVYDRLPDLDKIIKGDNIYVEDLDVMYATVSGLVSLAKNSSRGKSVVYQRLLDYALKMPDDFIELGAFLGKDIYRIDPNTFEKLDIEKYQNRYEPLVV